MRVVRYGVNCVRFNFDKAVSLPINRRKSGTQSQIPTPEIRLFKSSAVMSTMKAVLVETPGNADVMRIGQFPTPELKDKEVLVKIHSTAINRADTLQRMGKYPPPPGASPIMGLECAGVVDSVGPNCRRLSVGDKVMALLTGGGYAEYTAVPEDHAMVIPKQLSFDQAAAIPEAWLTAFQLLYDIGRLGEGDSKTPKTVLIHAGASGVGLAAIQLTVLAGHRAIATAGSAEKVKALQEYKTSLAINYNTHEFHQEVLKFTNNEGVDIVLDCIGGSYWSKNAASLKTDGCWVLYGLMGGISVDGELLGVILRKRIRLQGTTLRARTDAYKTGLIRDFCSKALPHFATGALRPVVDSVLPFEQISDAHKRMEANLNVGKIVIKIVKE